MKKITLLFVAVCFVLTSYSQQKAVAIAPAIFNILYVGVDNPLDIAVEGINDEDLSVSITGGTIKKRGRGEYYAKVKEAGTARICLSANGKSLGCKDFRCKLLEDPIAYVSPNNNSGKIHKSHLLTLSGVKIKQIGYFEVKYFITGFTLSGKYDDYETSAKSNSRTFTSEQKQIIKKLKIGSKVYIENIKCKGPDGVVRKLNDIVLQIL